MALYLNVPINCKFVMRFDYHGNLLKRMKILNNNLKLKKVQLYQRKKENIMEYNKILKNIDHFKKE